MSDFQQMFNQALLEKKMGVRALEREIIARFGLDNMVSRSLISDFRHGIRAPSYQAAFMIAEILEIDKGEFLKAAYNLKSKLRQESEYKRFLEFCAKNRIPI